MSIDPNISHAQLVTLYEVSKKINSQLDVKKLLGEIMDLAIEHLKAEKGLILLFDEESNELKVEVARHFEKTNIDDVVALSRSIIKRVEAEGKPVLLKSVPETERQHVSTSLVRHKIKSVICVPLKCKDKMIGTIYLDTTKKEHFFKEEDLGFLEGFANLAAVAIENARSYQEVERLNTNLEHKVEERTNELAQKNSDLQQAYQELKETQLQLIRSEKMASLGQLVAGIAHEINTPIGSISSNTGSFLKGFEKIRHQLDEEGDFDKDALKTFELLESLAKVNQTACQRISSIVKSLRNFARLDEEEFKTVDVHEGIDSTLSLIDHLCRHRVEVVKDYGDLPKVRCYANQINQVFMNILVNACQAIKEKGTITIQTRCENEMIHISISDTGVGIPKDNLDKIFDPGFTTKGVGVGTGLGLSISYKIIEEHGGTIEVESEEGKGSTFVIHLPVNFEVSASSP